MIELPPSMYERSAPLPAGRSGLGVCACSAIDTPPPVPQLAAEDPTGKAWGDALTVFGVLSAINNITG